MAILARHHTAQRGLDSCVHREYIEFPGVDVPPVQPEIERVGRYMCSNCNVMFAIDPMVCRHERQSLNGLYCHDCQTPMKHWANSAPSSAMGTVAAATGTLPYSLDADRVMGKVMTMPNARAALDLLVDVDHFLADESLRKVSR